LANLAFAIKVPNWLNKCSQDIWALRSQDIVHVVRGDDVRLASFERPYYAEQADKVRVISVEELTFAVLVFCMRSIVLGLYTVHSSDIFGLHLFAWHHLQGL